MKRLKKSMTPKRAIPEYFLLVALLHMRKGKRGNDVRFFTPSFILIDISYLRVEKGTKIFK